MTSCRRCNSADIREAAREIAQQRIRTQEFAVQELESPLQLPLERFGDLHSPKQLAPKLAARGKLITGIPYCLEIEDGKKLKNS